MTRATSLPVPTGAGLVAVVVAALGLSACTAPTGTPGAITPAQMTTYRDAVDDAADERAGYESLPVPEPRTVAVVGGARSLLRAAPRGLDTRGGAVTVTVGTAADDVAYERLCAGEADVVETVRPMAESEWAACRAVGLQVVQLPVAADATVAVVAADAGLEGGCLSQPELAGILADPPTVTSWTQLGLGEAQLSASADADVDTRVGWLIGTDEQRQAVVELPRRTRALSALRDRLAELRAASDRAAEELDRVRRSSGPGRADDATVTASRAAYDAAFAERARVRRHYVGAVARHDASLAARKAEQARQGRMIVLPYAAYRDRDRLAALAVSDATDTAGSTGSSGCVTPDDTSITEGTYPLTRPVLLTTTLRSWQRPPVTAFLDAYLRGLPLLAAEAGLVPAPAQRVAALLESVRDDDPPLLAPVETTAPSELSLPPPPAP